MKKLALILLALAPVALGAAVGSDPGTGQWISERLYVKVAPGGAPQLFAYLQGRGTVEWQGISLTNWYRVVATEEVDTLVAGLSSQPFVIHSSAYREWVMEPMLDPNDPKYPDELWRLESNALSPYGEVAANPDIDIDAPEGWDILTDARVLNPDGSPLIVIVHDNAMNENHPDLGEGAGLGNFWQNAAELGGTPGVDDDANGCVDDFHGCFAPGHDFACGHGTPVAGAIAAIGDNAVGVTGVAWRANLAHYTYSCGGSICGAVEAVDYAETIGARVFNASYGSNAGSQLCTGWEAVISDFSGLFVAAAGNGGTNNDAPNHFCPSDARNSNVLSVGAVRPNGTRYYNYGAVSVDLHGPSFTPAPGCGNSTSHGGGYGNFNGTSCASPTVAGIALMRTALCPNDSTLQIKEAMLDAVVTSADDARLSDLDGKSVTGGVANLFNVLSLPCGTPPPICVRDPLA